MHCDEIIKGRRRTYTEQCCESHRVRKLRVRGMAVAGTNDACFFLPI